MQQTELSTLILTRYNTLRQKRDEWIDLWRETAEYLLPGQEWFDTDTTAGETGGRKVYDTTPIISAQVQANGLHGHLLTPGRPFFRSQHRNDEINKSPAVREWFQYVDRVLYSLLDRSNFLDQASTFLLMGVTLNTAVMTVDDDDGVPRFRVRHLDNVAIAEGPDGQIDTVYREIKLAARNIVDRWPECPKHVKDIAKQHPDKMLDVIHAVEPVSDRIKPYLKRTDRPIVSIYMMKSGEILSQSGFDVMPVIVWRPRVNPHEIYGRGPGTDGLAQVKALNLIAKDQLIASQRATRPPMLISGKLKGRLSLAAEAFNYTDAAGASIEPIFQGQRIDVANASLELQQERVRQLFMVDFFTMLSRIDKQMTAREVAERSAEKVSLMAPMLGTLYTQFLDMALENAFQIARNNAMIPQPPEELRGEPFEIDYIGPLAQALKTNYDTQNIRQALMSIVEAANTAGPYAQDVLDQFKFGDIGRRLATGHGLEQDLLRDPQQVDALRRARAQQQQMAEQFQVAQQLKQLEEQPA